jgi:hypothetical protein
MKNHVIGNRSSFGIAGNSHFNFENFMLESTRQAAPGHCGQPHLVALGHCGEMVLYLLAEIFSALNRFNFRRIKGASN